MLTLKTTAPIIPSRKWLRMSTFQPSNAARLYCILQECHILWTMNIKGACEYRTAMDKTEQDWTKCNRTLSLKYLVMVMVEEMMMIMVMELVML